MKMQYPFRQATCHDNLGAVTPGTPWLELLDWFYIFAQSSLMFPILNSLRVRFSFRTASQDSAVTGLSPDMGQEVAHPPKKVPSAWESHTKLVHRQTCLAPKTNMGDFENLSTASPRITRPSSSASQPQYILPDDELSTIESDSRAKLEEGFKEFWSEICKTVLDCHNRTPSNAIKTAELEQARSVIQELKQRIHQQEEEIIHYQSETFRFIGPSEVSDRRISEELTSIYMSLSNWVESLPEPRDGGCNWDGVKQFMTGNGYELQPNRLSTTEQIADAREELMKHVTFSILRGNIFQPLLVGATEEQNSCLEELCSNMKSLQQGQGTSLT